MRHPAAETAKQSIRDCFPGYGHSVRKMSFFCLGRRKTKDFSARVVYQGTSATAYWLLGYREAEILEREEKGEVCNDELGIGCGEAGDLEMRAWGNM